MARPPKKKPEQGPDETESSGGGMLELTDRHLRFIDEYLVDLNATNAAVRAGYSTHSKPGSTSASSLGYKLLQDPRVRGEIERRKKARAEACEISAARVLEELGHIAFSDIGEVLETNGLGELGVRPLEKLEPRVRRTISKVTRKADGSITVDLHDKGRALKMLVDHLGLAAPVKHDVRVTEVSQMSTDELLRIVEEATHDPE